MIVEVFIHAVRKGASCAGFLARQLLVGALLVLPLTVHAMQEIDDGSLSGVSGRDGLTGVIATPTGGISASCLYLILDSSTYTRPSGATACTTASPNDSGNAYSSFMRIEGLNFSGVGLQGASPGGVSTLTTVFDVGSNAASGQNIPAGVGFTTTWTRSRFTFNALRQKANLNNSIGSVALDGDGSFSMFTPNGLFNNTVTGSALRLQLNNGQLYYRQQGSELVMNNMAVNLGFGTTAGAKFGFTPAGFQLNTNRFDFNLLYDIGYRASPGTPLVTSSGWLPMLEYGWQGGLKNMLVSVAPGGFGGTEGMHFSIQDDADTDFVWVIGDVPGASTYTMRINFGNWVKLPGAIYGLNAPSTTIDVINAGQGPGGISYMGAPATEIPADSGAIAIAIRSLSFLNYNTTVRIIDPSYGVGYKDFNWALIYTLGQLDANLYIYPGAQSVTTEGIRFDLTLAVQSPGAWNQNTHFMIGDTDATKNAGIGFINSNFWITIDNGYLELRPAETRSGFAFPAGIRLATGACTAAGSCSTGGFQWKMSASFGGGSLTNLSTPIRVFDLGLNLHASLLDVTLSPAPAGSSYIGFNWLAHLYQGTAGDPSTADSYISLSEPSRPTVQFQFNQISGDLAAANGKLDMRAGNESTDLQPRLVFEQTMEFGLTAVPTTGTPVIFNAVSIGTTPVTTMAIPGGKWYVSLGLKEQL